MPIVGKIAKCQQVIFIKREGSVKANMVELISNRIQKTIDIHGFRQLVIFPEGTTTNGRYLITFKRGAFVAGKTVQPVMLQYPWKHFDVSWVPVGPKTVFLMFRMLCQFHNKMTICYLKPVIPTQYEETNSIIFANKGIIQT
jgi:lysophosphatidylcholine acyltransferase/lyso-PAF acetyltransferase